MRQRWFVAAVLGVSTLAMGQQPKIDNAQMHTESASAGWQQRSIAFNMPMARSGLATR
jgi:hypothetical protein